MRTLVRAFFGVAVVGIAWAVMAGGCLPLINEGPPDGGFALQAAYTYPGCSETGPNMCPKAGDFICALSTITQKYNACQLDVDCVGVSTNDCLGFSDCHLAAVNRANVDAFSTEIAAEVVRYCGDGDAGTPCTMRGNCSGFWEGPVCRHGFCQFRFDAGF